jgi:hypothetical protein
MDRKIAENTVGMDCEEHCWHGWGQAATHILAFLPFIISAFTFFIFKPTGSSWLKEASQQPGTKLESQASKESSLDTWPEYFGWTRDLSSLIGHSIWVLWLDNRPEFFGWTLNLSSLFGHSTWDTRPEFFGWTLDLSSYSWHNDAADCWSAKQCDCRLPPVWIIRPSHP